MELVKDYNGVKVYRNYVNGVEFFKIYGDEDITATTCINDDRFKIKGRLVVQYQRGAYKFGEEIQICIFSPKSDGVNLEYRNKSKYNFTELYFTPDQYVDLLLRLLTLKKYLRELNEKGDGQK